MKLHIPIILGLLIIVVFVICLFMNKKVREGFTSLLPGNKSLVQTENLNIDGRYYPVDSNNQLLDTIYSLSLISKGNKVVIMLENETKLSQLGEPCMRNEDCSTGLCDTNGNYNAKGSCVIPDASTISTALMNTDGEMKFYKYFLYRGTDNKVYRYNSLTNQTNKYVNNVDGFASVSFKVFFYKKNRVLRKYTIDADEPNERIYNDIRSDIVPIDNNYVFFARDPSHNVCYWDGNDITDLPAYNAQKIRSKEKNKLYYVDITTEQVGKLNKNGSNWNNMLYEDEDISGVKLISLTRDDKLYVTTHHNKLYKLIFNNNSATHVLLDEDESNEIKNVRGINQNTVYYTKGTDRRLYRNINGNIEETDITNVEKLSFDLNRNLFAMIGSNHSLVKVDDLTSVPIPSDTNQLSGINKLSVFNNITPLNNEAIYAENNKKNFNGYGIIYGEYKLNKDTDKKYIQVKTNLIKDQNANNIIQNLLPNGTEININNDNSAVLLETNNGNRFKMTREFGEDVKNFDDIEKVGLQSNINQITMPQVQLSDQLCPLGYNECYDETTNAMYCGYQESGFSEGEQPRCLPHSRVCALNKDQTGGFEMCNPNVTIRRTPSRLNMLPSILNTDFYGEENNPVVNCRYLFNELTNKGLNNLSILTQVKNTDGKTEFKSLGTEFFSPGEGGSSMILQDTPLTNLLNTNPDTTSISTSLASFIGILLILTILHGVDSQFISKCKNELVRAKACNADGTVTSQISDTCKTIITDLQDVDARINEMELTQFKLELASSANIGPNICSFYLKSYKNYALQEPEYYCQGNTNGSTSLSLIKGGHINAISAGDINNMGQSQHWVFEDFDSFIINNSNLKIFRTLIRSQNGLYLEPTHADIQSFSRTGKETSYKANLVSRPTNYWIIVATQFNSDAVTEINNSLEGAFVESGVDYNCD